MDNLGRQDRSTVLGNILFRDTKFQAYKWPLMHRKARIKVFPKGPGPLGWLGSLVSGDPEHSSYFRPAFRQYTASIKWPHFSVSKIC